MKVSRILKEVDIEKEIPQLDNTKTTPSNSIPTKLFKDNIDLYSDIITKMYNKSVHTILAPFLINLS